MPTLTQRLRAIVKAEWHEEQHPRDHGKFATAPGGDGKSDGHLEYVDSADAIKTDDDSVRDLASELLDNGAKVTADGRVLVFHRTTETNARTINATGKMVGKEDGIFFSTSLTGQAENFGESVVRALIPLSMLQLDDTFGDEAHVRIPTRRAGASVNIAPYLIRGEKGKSLAHRVRALLKSRDASNHEHAADGKFTSGAGGGGSGDKPSGGKPDKPKPDRPKTEQGIHETATTTAHGFLRKMAGKIAALPKATVQKSVSVCKSLYAKAEKKYGPRWAKAIVGTAIVTMPTPFTMGSVALMTGLAHVWTKYVTGRPGEKSGDELDMDEIERLAAELLEEMRAAVGDVEEAGAKTLGRLKRLLKADWHEDKHPRDHGKFSSKPGAEGGGGDDGPSDKPEQASDAGARLAIATGYQETPETQKLAERRQEAAYAIHADMDPGHIEYAVSGWLDAVRAEHGHALTHLQAAGATEAETAKVQRAIDKPAAQQKIDKIAAKLMEQRQECAKLNEEYAAFEEAGPPTVDYPDEPDFEPSEAPEQPSTDLDDAEYDAAMETYDREYEAWEKTEAKREREHEAAIDEANAQAERDHAKAEREWESQRAKLERAKDAAGDKFDRLSDALGNAIENWSDSIETAIQEVGDTIAERLDEASDNVRDRIEQAEADDPEPEEPDEPDDDEGDAAGKSLVGRLKRILTA